MDGYKPLTCPSKELIRASWADLITIVDQERLFEGLSKNPF